MRVSAVIIGTDTLYGWSSDGTFIGSTLTEDDFTFENEAYKIVDLFVGLEVWPESHWPGFALRQTDVL